MILKTILDYLNSYNGLGATAYAETPINTPSKYILLEQIGSSKENLIKTTRIAFQSIAPTLFEAASLAEDVINAIDNAISLDIVCSVDLNSNYNFTNTATKQYRYQTVFDIIHY